MYRTITSIGPIQHEEPDGSVFKCGIPRERKGSIQGCPGLLVVGVRYVEIFGLPKGDHDEQSV